ncbi:rab9 effector protein with kelch motifs isoform X2 [Perca fluviatilis]|uniref:rab9 effector protein with kelch motifs isoform X2 n=1 Tax=Perca fluviatilis TaxID=8168 RepID=UPI0019653431|nr:rab9 effector protein with kelch motifs isoform X2 [Perca fluviatilis]
MGRLNFYVLCSLRDAPRQFISKSNRSCFHVHIPLPLPKHLVIFGLGEWNCSETTISVDVLVSAEVPAQKIGTLSAQARCLTWEGDWSTDIVTVAAERGRRGVYGKIVLTVCREPQDEASVFSSTPLVRGKLLFPDQHDATDLSCTLHQSAGNETITLNSSHLGDSVCYADIQVNKTDTSDSTMGNNKLLFWPTDKTPRCRVIRKIGHLTWSSEDADCLGEDIDQASSPKKRRLEDIDQASSPKKRRLEDIDQASSPKKRRLSRMNSIEEITVQIKNENREVSVCPSKRCSHTMCLSDFDTAILIGGETADQNCCKDSLWKLELDNDFWFPMNSSASGPVPPCARGHSATYDPDSKSVYVYGGLREGQRYNELYILDTLTWKWKLVTAKGDVPNVAYHSAAFYKKELFVFGGVKPSRSSVDKSCSNALYIFNPEFELWYQPIVDGDKPLPRFGHSATLMSQKLIIFGGRQTAAYLNDVHVLDLGFMEYTAVKCGNMPPLPRGFHAALPVSDNRILVSGGCSAIGALQDVHMFNTDTNMWSSVVSPPLCSKPRAGHSMINLSSSILTDAERREQGENVSVHCTLLVFGGSDSSGTFYNDTVKCTVAIPGNK